MKLRRATRIEHSLFGAKVAFVRAATGLGVMGLGALAVGAVAIGALAIRVLAVKRGKIERLDDGGTNSHVRWPDPSGEGPISPASRHAHKEEGSELPGDTLLRRLGGSLEPLGSRRSTA